MQDNMESQGLPALDENLKKAVTELLVLRIMDRRELYIGELAETIHEISGGVLNIVFPYAAMYRMESAGYIRECGKRIAPDGRRRQYFQITEAGRQRLELLLSIYRRFMQGVDRILDEEADRS